MRGYVIKSKDLVDARLYADRYDLISALRIPPGPHIAEIGVAHGDFSQFLIETLRPTVFAALDLFEMHKYATHWGVPQEVLLNGMPHEAFYRDRFKETSCKMLILRGLSFETIPTLPINDFDLVYIDAGHDYENVKRDANLAASKLKASGVLVFNDYIMYDHSLKESYGVVAAVNELLATDEWVVIGFALQKDMFCDIALRRR